ncbi:superoxide dismutase [Cyclobacterium marinum]|uniref:Superoxide dismutase n=1 Tax=Cyclobacterium marinum (strain ATCC 25205 / DSM 745 / LMG 13164 / NCIMB 1802) TaxID=880070 RepID=G0J0Y6_CYCMS|nr:superoxide dismutase [Cyclobacterium marinum]AEL25112.1 Manganese/iron superoxide dismutase [Cyclobacterium marinum DSM 745]
MHKLPELPYDKNALSPVITEEGFDYHHGKHHMAYVNNLNNLIKDSLWEEKSLKTIVTDSFNEGNTAVFNNSAQHFNHNFFWKCLSPNQGGAPTGKIAELIDRDFNGFETFKKDFSEAAVKLFGSGWAWLVLNNENKLQIVPLKDANTPVTFNVKPLLTLDVWEHAYYIDHRNLRPKFVDGFWEIINWEFVNKNILQ